MPLAFMSPQLTRQVLLGAHPPDLTADEFVKRIDLPLPWEHQRLSLDLD